MACRVWGLQGGLSVLRRRSGKITARALVRWSTELTEQVLRLRDAGDVVEVALYILLRLESRSVCLRALRLRDAALARHTHVLVVTHALFVQSADNLVFFPTEPFSPFMQALHHFPLHLGARVVEVRVEEALENFFGELIYIDGVVVPGFDN